MSTISQKFSSFPAPVNSAFMCEGNMSYSGPILKMFCKVVIKLGCSVACTPH